MKTLYLSDTSANIVVDPEIDYVGTLRNEDRYDIRNVFYAEEPMHVVYQCGEIREEIDAKKGDIILLFYNNNYNKYRLDTIRTKQWAANIKNRRAIEQREKEEWAARNAEKAACDCENCCVECDCCAAPTAEPTIEYTVPVKESKVSKIKKAIKKAVKKA